MERFCDLTLVSKSYTKDSLGQLVATETTTDVMGTVRSVSAAEFFRGGEEGLKPECVFLVWAYDYGDQEEVVYNGTTYAVYRKYFNDDGKVELYTEKKVGV